MVENAESGRRQYALRDRAVTMGWPLERIVTIDGDPGQSAASASDREGFQHLVAEVGMGRAGIVMGIEVSRLARNNADWHRLLEICALTRTLILDEDGIYNPNHFNDRLVLGLKGAMSEAELHVLRARLRGGILNQARRAELKMRLPTGFVRDPQGKTVHDPDIEVQESCRLLFSTFARTGAATATARHWRDQGLRFPRRLHTGPQKGELVWGALTEGRAREILRNPCYAGAFVYGRRRQFRRVDGKILQVARGRDEWVAEEQRTRILALARDFPAMWSSEATADRDRKRMARLLIEDVTLVKGDEVAVHVRFRGGATRSLSVPRAKASWETWTTPPGVVARIDVPTDSGHGAIDGVTKSG